MTWQIQTNGHTVCVFAFLPRVRGEDRYQPPVCMVIMKIVPAAS